jgi:hypothetical protein
LPFRMRIWEDWDPIYWFNHVTFLCLFQVGIWISNIIYCYPPFLCSVSYWRGECSFYRHLWNCWPLLFKLFFIICRKFITSQLSCLKSKCGLLPSLGFRRQSVSHRNHLIENVHALADLSQITDKLYHIMLYTSTWSRIELTTSMVIDTDCIGSCKSNYHTITATRAPA